MSKITPKKFYKIESKFIGILKMWSFVFNKLDVAKSEFVKLFL